MQFETFEEAKDKSEPFPEKTEVPVKENIPDDAFVVVRMRKDIRDKLHIYKYKYGFKSISELLEKILKTLD